MLKFIIFFSLVSFLVANDTNNTKIVNKDTNITKAKKTDSNLTKEQLLQKHVEEQMKREAKYAKEKAFYMGKDYNLTEHQVDPKSLKKIKTIEPEYDFDMDDVYN